MPGKSSWFHVDVGHLEREEKSCPEGIGKKIPDKTAGYPYYVQSVPYSIFEISAKKVTEADYIKGFQKTIEEEGIV